MKDHIKCNGLNIPMDYVINTVNDDIKNDFACDRQLQALSFRHGLHEYGPMTWREVGNRMGILGSSACKRAHKYLDKIYGSYIEEKINKNNEEIKKIEYKMKVVLIYFFAIYYLFQPMSRIIRICRAIKTRSFY